MLKNYNDVKKSAGILPALFYLNITISRALETNLFLLFSSARRAPRLTKTMMHPTPPIAWTTKHPQSSTMQPQQPLPSMQKPTSNEHQNNTRPKLQAGETNR